MTLLAGRTALITGAASGVGLAIAEAFAIQGASVVGLDTSAGARSDFAAGLEALGAEADLREADVSDRRSVIAALGRGLPHDRLDILVNAAGLREIVGPLELSLEEWQRVLAVNLTGTFICAQVAARIMATRRSGSIINISSTAGLIGETNRAAYCASKHGVLGLTKSLARDLGPLGIRVNALCPGLLRTPMTENYFTDEFVRGLASTIPLGTYGTPAQAAQAALFLASDMAGYINGVALPVDGGFLAEKFFTVGAQ
jgi:NAD(P)-dependent dehydrogenase (short-subunit alcohol dehydrogenase family)